MDNSFGIMLKICKIALKAIFFYKIRSEIVMECTKNFSKVATRTCVLLSWIPGQKRIKGHRMDEHLAKEAAPSMPIGQEPFFAVDSHLSKKDVRKEEKASRNR